MRGSTQFTQWSLHFAKVEFANGASTPNTQNEAPFLEMVFFIKHPEEREKCNNYFAK